MKRFWIMLLAVAMALVIALPAGAGKPVKPPTSVPIAVFMDAEPVWVHEGADLIRYTVTLRNKTSTDIEDVDVEFIAAGETTQMGVGTVSADDTVKLEDVLSRPVSQFSEFYPCGFGDECPLPAIAKVFVEDAIVTETEISTPLMPNPPCGFDNGEATLTGGQVCIWNPPSSGKWTVSVTPVKAVTRPTRMMVSVRDGVPGNWCTVPDVADTGVVFRRLMPGDTAFELQVLLPGSGGQSLDGLADGQCNSGGAGGDYFAVGNPEAFYFYTSIDGTATISQP